MRLEQGVCEQRLLVVHEVRSARKSRVCALEQALRTPSMLAALPAMSLGPRYTPLLFFGPWVCLGGKPRVQVQVIHKLLQLAHLRA